MEKGVFLAKKKNGEIYFRASLTHHGHHISLGSFITESEASEAYSEASTILNDNTISLTTPLSSSLSFEKKVSLINLRDNKMYFKNPIYILPTYFEYYYSEDYILKFDVDDLFYYADHKIMKRGNHLFVADYGMQINILSRYGIHNHSVPGKDYIFVNGDMTDLRYKNILVINRYKGVTRLEESGRYIYIAKIHVNGDYIIGKYSSENEAGVAYNKAADILNSRGVSIEFERNYIDGMSSIQYSSLYNKIKISKKINNFGSSPSDIP